MAPLLKRHLVLSWESKRNLAHENVFNAEIGADYHQEFLTKPISKFLSKHNTTVLIILPQVQSFNYLLRNDQNAYRVKCETKPQNLKRYVAILKCDNLLWQY